MSSATKKEYTMRLAILTIAFGLLLSGSQTVSAQTPESVVTGQHSIAGDGLQNLHPGTNKSIEVVAIGSDSSFNRIQFAVFNGTDGTVNSLQAKVELRDSSGALIGADATDDIRPLTISPGEFAIGVSYISGKFPPDTIISIKIIDFLDGPHSRASNLHFGDVTLRDDVIVGEFINPSDKDRRQAKLVGVCFDNTGSLVAGDTEWIDEPMPVNEPVSFQFSISPWVDAPCEAFIVSG
ncbi:MAG: hypothetical protein M9953_03185 [Thermomicrobiales bacterium]|nr:hypothetical protein [Thermomicrobiales bacterium]MCO5218644.1 hypothetical protein [Thermomicrobiales bacterium]MCO5224321.1 hypothetical protein [Thermomicrobiales bacterium]MCO5229060.1 hypothetical protein [Thermomicrobiales bacterium]